MPILASPHFSNVARNLLEAVLHYNSIMEETIHLISLVTLLWNVFYFICYIFNFLWESYLFKPKFAQSEQHDVHFHHKFARFALATCHVHEGTWKIWNQNAFFHSKSEAAFKLMLFLSPNFDIFADINMKHKNKATNA